jgi:hypothetical protein
MKKTLAGKYEIIKEIGQGGAGRVYLAYDTHLRHEVAVKQITHEKARKTGSLWHEVEVLKQMEHPALPTVFDYFSEMGCDYMVLEYVRGSTLTDYVRERGVMKQAQALALMQKLLSALAYLHSFSPPIVYCDLKPDNIILKGNGEVKLVDFGTVFILYSDGKRAIRSGTPGFSAPELLAGRECSESSDIFSLGALLYFLLTGEAPNDKRKGRLSLGIKGVIARCLHNSPDKRYQNVQQLHDDLQNHRYLARPHMAARLARKLWQLAAPLLLAALGFFIIYREHTVMSAPFISWFDEISPSVAAGLCLLLGGLYFLLVALGHKEHEVKITKSLHLTGKRYIGLLTVIFSFLVLTVTGQLRALETEAGHYLEVEEEVLLNSLSVFFRHHEGHKLLIKDDAVYYPTNNLLIEIPLAELPQGKEFVVKVVAEADDASYESREFLICVGE